MSQEPIDDANQEPIQNANQSGQTAEHLRATNQLIAHARTELGRVISGQNDAIEEVLIAVLCQDMRCSRACLVSPRR